MTTKNLMMTAPAASGGAFTDSFNRSDETLTASADWGSFHTYASPAIVSNVVRATTTSALNAARVVSGTFSDNQYAQAELVTSTGSASAHIALLGVRMSPSNSDYYNLYWEDGGSWLLRKSVSGTTSNLASGSVATSVPDTMRIEADGTTIRAIINGTEVASVTDAAISTGRPGLAIFTNSTTATVEFDDFEAGDL